jgi:hypothetical protein
VVPKLLEPPDDVIVRPVFGDIVYEQRADGAAVVCRGDGAVTFLSGCMVSRYSTDGEQLSSDFESPDTLPCRGAALSSAGHTKRDLSVIGAPTQTSENNALRRPQRTLSEDDAETNSDMLQCFGERRNQR